MILGIGAAMNNGLNRVFYRETVRDSGVGDEKVIRQQGGIGVYAHVRIAVHALARGQGKIFAWNAGLNIPAKFAPAVAQGVQDAMNAGVLAGLELTDVHTAIEDGSYHEVDSTTDAFREASEEAAIAAFRQAHPMILEAWSLMKITVPVEFVSAVEAMVTSRGGHAEAIRSDTPDPTVTASVPASRANDLIAEFLQISDGHATVSIASAGFRPRPEPPDTVEQWVASR
jgi:elongation factor G